MNIKLTQENPVEPNQQEFVQAEAARAAEELGVKDDKPNEENAPAVVETPVAPAESTETPTTETTETVATVTPEIEEEDELDIPTFYNPWAQQPSAPQQQEQPQQPQVQAPPQVPTPAAPASLDPTQFTDQYGNVDMAKFTQAMQLRDQALVAQVQQSVTANYQTDYQAVLKQAVEQASQTATQQVMAAKTEERAWERTFDKYPQVKQNKDLRDQIHKMRMGEVAITGKNVSPVKIAERYFAQMALARNEGVRQATTQTEVQAVAHLETASNTASDKGLKAQTDWGKIDSRDRRESTAARESLLKQMLADGKL